MVTFMVLLISSLFLYQCVTSFEYSDMEEFFKHTGAAGTQHGKDKNDPDYYKSNSGIPHLPTMTGFMGTHGTYRFLTIHEQVALLIGDGKHGVWRAQENGFIREYRKKGRTGLPKGVDANDLSGQSTADRLKYTNAIEQDYAPFLPDESWEGYKYESDKISKGDGKYDNVKDAQNFIDLTIYHPKYKGKYDKHAPIDLPQFYCTMTQNDYKFMMNAWKYATAQPGANKIGPLGKRAGLDIKENYANVLQFKFFADAGLWANIGHGTEASRRSVKTAAEWKNRNQNINYQRVDDNRVESEVYLFERQFFNKMFLFITFVMDSKVNNKAYSYIRPDGHYYNKLKAKGYTLKNTVYNDFPPAYIENTGITVNKAYGLPVYGHHHPRRHEHNLIGGACPNKGGDWGTYPWGTSGAGFPTNYEEITPLCDAFVLDMKLWMNLDKPTWNDPQLFLGNAGTNSKQVVSYTADANVYGVFSDPYLVNLGKKNPYEMDLTGQNKVVNGEKEKMARVTFNLDFGRLGKYMDFVKVKAIGGGSDGHGNEAGGERDKDGGVKCNGAGENIMKKNSMMFPLVISVIVVMLYNKV